MVTPYLGQIILFSFGFNPKNYQLCNGQTLAINQNQALFSLLGTYYGGNGTNTFALPDLRGRTPVSIGQGAGLSNYVIGEKTGAESVTLVQNNLPAHNHSMNANNTASTTGAPANGVLAVVPTITSGGTSTSINVYGSTINGTMAGTALATTGAGQSVQIIQPYTVLSFAIAMNGIYPSRN